MRMHLLLAAALLFAGTPVVAGDDDGGDDRGEDGGGGRHGRDRHSDDVSVRLARVRRDAGSSLVRLHVRNRGRDDQAAVLLRLTADGSGGTELWSATVALPARRSVAFRVTADPPAGTTFLEATATLVGVDDQYPSDNVARLPLAGGGTAPGLASLGAAIYVANCASCHGTDARGIGEAPWIRRAPAGEILEAVREGEDGMPTFPGLSLEDCRALAAYLLDPEGATPPPPPPPPPPGTPVSYAGQVKSLLDARCTACHSGTSAAGGIRLDTARWAATNASAALAAAQAGRMPKGGTPLSADELALLSDWIAGGKQP